MVDRASDKLSEELAVFVMPNRSNSIQLPPGWSEPTWVGSQLWAIPPGGVMPTPVVDTRNCPVLEGWRRAVEEFHRSAIGLSEAIRAQLISVDELGLLERLGINEDLPPLERAVSWASQMGRLSPSVAQVRVLEFCQAQDITLCKLVDLIETARVQVRHGVLCYRSKPNKSQGKPAWQKTRSHKPY